MGLTKFKICGAPKFEKSFTPLDKILIEFSVMKYRVLERGLCILIHCFGFINLFLSQSYNKICYWKSPILVIT